MICQVRAKIHVGNRCWVVLLIYILNGEVEVLGVYCAGFIQRGRWLCVGEGRS